MPRRSWPLVVFLLVLLLLPAALQASEPWQIDVLASVWSFFISWSDNGCGADPDGRCLGEQRATADNGCRADPNGRCLPGPGATATTDNGCGLDPDGRCRN